MTAPRAGQAVSRRTAAAFPPPFSEGSVLSSRSPLASGTRPSSERLHHHERGPGHPPRDAGAVCARVGKPTDSAGGVLGDPHAVLPRPLATARRRRFSSVTRNAGSCRVSPAGARGAGWPRSPPRFERGRTPPPAGLVHAQPRPRQPLRALPFPELTQHYMLFGIYLLHFPATDCSLTSRAPTGRRVTLGRGWGRWMDSEPSFLGGSRGYAGPPRQWKRPAPRQNRFCWLGSPGTSLPGQVPRTR